MDILYDNFIDELDMDVYIINASASKAEVSAECMDIINKCYLKKKANVQDYGCYTPMK